MPVAATTIYRRAMTDAIEPFTIAVPQDQLDDLADRLQRTRWPDEETTVGTDEPWKQGLPLQFARRLASHWAADYDWRRAETTLNAFPQFRTTIDGLGIHFLHVRSPQADALPVVMTHGWPGRSSSS